MNIKFNNSTTLLPKLVGETKHYPPAVKEWNDSVYTYNKNYLKNLPTKDIATNKIIKSYFSLNDCKHLARSKRMRILIRKLAGTNIFIAKPEFKQTNDNLSLTIYTLDRERQLLLRKFFYNIRKCENTRKIKNMSPINKYNTYELWRNKYGINKSLKNLENKTLMGFKNNLANRIKFIKNKYLLFAGNSSGSLLKYKHININRTHYLKTKSNIYALRRIRKNIYTNFNEKFSKYKIIKKINIPYFGSKFLSEAKFLRFFNQFKNNSLQARKRVYYSYIKGILFLLGIKVLSLNLDGNIRKEKVQNLYSIYKT